MMDSSVEHTHSNVRLQDIRRSGRGWQALFPGRQVWCIRRYAMDSCTLFMERPIMNTLSKLFLAVLASASGLAAHAGDSNFTLTNGTGFEIESIFPPTKARTWDSDFFGEGTLRNGAHRLVAFSNKSGHCSYDLTIHRIGY
jgi:hypothetical protein